MRILAARYNFTDEQVAPFLASLEMTGQDVDLIWLDTARKESRHPALMRWFEYRDICSDLVEDDMVLLTDSRDVVVQDNLDHMDVDADKINVFLEGPRIRESFINYRWLVESVGQERADQLQFNVIANCGVVVGPARLLGALARQMVALFDDRNHWGQDQGIYNHMVYGSFRQVCRFHTNELGPAVMCGHTMIGELFLEGSCYKRRNGLTPTIVHQYDRMHKHHLC